MRIVEIAKLSNGSHNNQTGNFRTIPNGWALVPNGMETPNFPFGELEAEEIEGVMRVTKWTPLPIPEPVPEPIPEPTTDEVLNVLLGVE